MNVSLRRLAALALLVFAAGQTLVLTELTHDNDNVGQAFTSAILAITLIVAGVVDRFDRWWSSTIALAASILATITMLPYADHIVYFDAAWEFSPIALVLLGSVAAAVFCTADLVLRLRHRSTTAPAWAAAGYGALVGGLAMLIVASFVLTYSSLDTVSALEREGATELKMSEIKFKPSELTAAVGEPVKLVVENDDLAPHTFVLAASWAAIDTRFNAGDEKLIAFTIAQPGAYEFRCDIEGHEKMKGTINVR